MPNSWFDFSEPDSQGGSYDAQVMQLRHRQRLADLMQQQAMAPVESAAPNAPISWTQGLAKVLQGYTAGKRQRDLDERYAGLGQQDTGRLQATINALGQPKTETVAPTSGPQVQLANGAGTLDASLPGFSSHRLLTPMEQLAIIQQSSAQGGPLTRAGLGPYAAMAAKQATADAERQRLVGALEGEQPPPGIPPAQWKQMVQSQPDVAQKVQQEALVRNSLPRPPLSPEQQFIQQFTAKGGSLLDAHRAWSGAGRAPTATASGGAGPVAAPEIDANSGSILAQTGLSLPAFMALTGHSAQLPRDHESRNRAFKEAEAFTKRTGTDVSTFASQYKAVNEALEKNLSRYNTTKVMEGELQGTLENFAPVADAVGAGALKIANVAELLAKGEVNDPVTNQYAFQINQMRSELAGYSAALRGETKPDQADLNEANRVIKNGLSSGGAKGFRTAVEQSTQKMGQVLQQNIDRTQRQVWDLFGVGKNFKPHAKELSPEDQQAMDWANANPKDPRAAKIKAKLGVH